MKYGVISALFISILWSVLAILQLWFSILDIDVFLKLTVTAGILLVIIVIVTLVIREYLSDKQLKKEGFLDD
ncbi:hypothetical protein [Acinetobacter ursingii]|uniref:Uncharacterized protein n=1 Tax=Acinetobacter ursingii TaxID=108980 RepID=A0A3D2SIX8_9GAMM|nr:hypothetical protein [Acinetobacter ursingii]MCH2005037.1 hypothetical protein [Acinetobacter ursingii]MCU4609578.1 hypothetical protein [Acinetobacter ursingii]HCK29381.1 hypothetical protein [Acinetobacter ursingii]